jgi:hypothetical protein
LATSFHANAAIKLDLLTHKGRVAKCLGAIVLVIAIRINPRAALAPFAAETVGAMIRSAFVIFIAR